jgi:hypothetical protein
MAEPLHIAVLGDLHGHFTLAYRVLRRLERERGLRLDLILQVGDLGAFPPPFRLDDATARFAAHDPDELSFAAYVEGSGEAEAVLSPEAPPERRLEADLVFIKGNHEDFEYLHALSALEPGPIPVDRHGRLRYLRNGEPFTFERRGHRVRIAGLGGIARSGQPGDDPASPYYTRSEWRALRALGPLDLFLSHEPPYGAFGHHPRYGTSGSPEVQTFLQESAPRFHFCGHYHRDGQALPAPSGTQSFELNAVNFLRAHQLNPGCIGLLTWPGAEHARFELLADPWLAEYTKHTFRQL